MLAIWLPSLFRSLLLESSPWGASSCKFILPGHSSGSWRIRRKRLEAGKGLAEELPYTASQGEFSISITEFGPA